MEEGEEKGNEVEREEEGKEEGKVEEGGGRERYCSLKEIFRRLRIK